MVKAGNGNDRNREQQEWQQAHPAGFVPTVMARRGHETYDCSGCGQTRNYGYKGF
jgi:hypothetical protein